MMRRCVSIGCDLVADRITGHCYLHVISKREPRKRPGRRFPRFRSHASGITNQTERITFTDGSYQDRWLGEDGFLHRDGAPAIEERDAAHALRTEVFYREGTLSRYDGPARIDYSPTGLVLRKEWLSNGETHRIDGPAVIEYDQGTFTMREEWHLFDRRHGDFRALHASLASRAMNTRIREFERSSYGVLLHEGLTIEEITAALLADLHSVEGIRALHEGAPLEWARAFEHADAS